ncbi:MAG TPA: PAS domain-containing protein, partial [Bradyrhizobium sp.]
MQSRHHFDLPTTAPDSADQRGTDGELGMLREVIQLLPGGVTVQDEQGRFLLVNDAAAAQLGITTPSANSSEIEHRRETCLELIRTGRTTVSEEAVGHGQHKQILLTTHRPVRIA